MSGFFPSGLYSHNQFAIVAGVGDDIPHVRLPKSEKRLRIPKKSELLDALATDFPPVEPAAFIARLESVGVNAAWHLAGPLRDVVAVGVFDHDEYVRNYRRGIKYRCLAKAIDLLIVDPATMQVDDQDPRGFILATDRPVAVASPLLDPKFQRRHFAGIGRDRVGRDGAVAA